MKNVLSMYDFEISTFWCSYVWESKYIIIPSTIQGVWAYEIDKIKCYSQIEMVSNKNYHQDKFLSWSIRTTCYNVRAVQYSSENGTQSNS